jgi:exodeoxyribonuclease V alpha subunit
VVVSVSRDAAGTARAGAGSEAGDELVAVFRREAELVSVPVVGAPAAAAIAPAFAMTVHKAQGSEFDDVILVLPEVDLPLLTRELVYTAMTRARRSVLLVGSIDLLARAVSRTIERHSGIAERLGDFRE